jgi:hypothetical protein
MASIMEATRAPRPGERHTGELQAEAEIPLDLGPNGSAMAAILAAATGVLALGFLTSLAAAALGVREWLEFQRRVGPLSGKTTMAGVAWLIAWALLHLAWRRRDVPFVPVVLLAGALIIVGNLLMFPPIFERLEPW